MTIIEAAKLLHLTDSVTKTAIRKAYRHAAHDHHPDTHGSNEQFIKLKQAYDLLIATPITAIRSAVITSMQPTKAAPYDPFIDLNYHNHRFFEPERPSIEGFERSVRARGCPHCHGSGTISKNTRPQLGFFGLETRLCKCQWM